MIKIAKKPELIRKVFSITKGQYKKLKQMQKREGYRYVGETLRKVLKEAL